MWTRQQLAEPHSFVGAGIRADVSHIPPWLTGLSRTLEQGGIIPPAFVNSVALNVYHDGTEGLAQHFDDAVRFKQPIFSLRLFSDARLSFGSQYYGFCNSAFGIPLPRGCICIMEEYSYAANGLKHCVRPADMTCKSAAVILRQMHELATEEARRYDQEVDFPSWLSTISLSPQAAPFSEQKMAEARALDQPQK